MDTLNDSVIVRDTQELEVTTAKSQIATHDDNILDKVKRTDINGNDVFIAFDFVRKGLGDRDMFSTKVFFSTLEALNILERNDIGDWSPTNEALTNHPSWFVKEENTSKWGMRPGIRNEFEEEFIHPFYAPVASKMQSLYKQEKKDVANAKRREKRIKDNAKKQRDELRKGLK